MPPSEAVEPAPAAQANNEGDDVVDRPTARAIRSDLQSDLARVLYCDETDLSDDATFVELGLDSILGLEFLASINARYGIRENIDAVYEHPTLAQLTQYLAQRVSAQAGDR
ncbi:acyl carrier protein [Micromonospora profundi]|uniref:acyl carrier protein n=1 Tax=Micromonospora profundi TaxID=1420889 RepID=UPI0033A1F077